MDDKKTVTEWSELWKAIALTSKNKSKPEILKPVLVFWKDMVFNYYDFVFCKYREDRGPNMEHSAEIQFRGERFETRVFCTKSEYQELVEILKDTYEGVSKEDETDSQS